MAEMKNSDEGSLPVRSLDALEDTLQDVRASDELEQLRQKRVEKLFKRAAFMPALFPNLYGVDEEELDERVHDIPSEALRQSHPKWLSAHLYSRNPNSRRQGRNYGKNVLLSADENKAIVNVPEIYAVGAESTYASTPRAKARKQDRRNIDRIRAGAHALERPIEVMSNYYDMYSDDINIFRSVIELVKHPWQANAKSGLDVINMAYRTRDVLQGTLRSVADVREWSQEDLDLVLLGLDKRLMQGRGRDALELKKKNWQELVRVIGNYTIDKKRLVGDRIDRARRESETRLTQA